MSADRSIPEMPTTRRYTLNQLETAASALRSGAIVAFPTETVYGLGANAFDPVAIARVFEAKGRPQDNPLIVHVADRAMLERIARHVPPMAETAIASFWPGPLTILLPKSRELPMAVTAGLDTVAVRMPDDPSASELIRLAGVPLVAPSANRSGRPSATTWQAVAEDLDGRIDGIVCGPPTRIGLESTVLDVVQDPPRVLRHGATNLHMLQGVIPGVVDADPSLDPRSDAAAPSPGLKHRHYQPKASVRIVSPAIAANRDSIPLRRGWIGIHPPPSSIDYAMVVLVDNLDAYAARLFEAFREMDHEAVEVIDCEPVAAEGIGRAIMDRLRRASEK